MINKPLASRGLSSPTTEDIGPHADIVSGLECLVKQQARQIEKLEARIEEMEDHFGRQIAEMRREMAAPPIRVETATDHLDRLFSEMRRLGLRQTTVRDAATLTGVSKPHMQKLKPYLAADMRFTLMKDPRRSNRYLIRIV